MENQTGKPKGYAFVTVPKHVSKELIKLSSIDFKGKFLLIEEARKKNNVTM